MLRYGDYIVFVIDMVIPLGNHLEYVLFATIVGIVYLYFMMLSFWSVACWFCLMLHIVIFYGFFSPITVSFHFWVCNAMNYDHSKFGYIYVGAEVKSGQNFEVELEDDGGRILHLSQVIHKELWFPYFCVDIT